ncbi:MAG: hypothetical protein HYU66_24490 [Armatimonadetes bacterium]|nr:hypothetical protein [Armatimonadota bacterium]
MRRLSLALLALPLLVLAAEKSGPEPGVSLMLGIKPFNHDGDRYCVTCKTAPNPLVVAFVTHNDEATQKLLTAAEKAFKDGEEKHLNVAIVLPGAGEEIDALKQWILDQKLTAPAAIVPADNKTLQTWHLNPKVANTVVFLKEHKVVRTAVELKLDDLAENLKSIVG